MSKNYYFNLLIFVIIILLLGCAKTNEEPNDEINQAVKLNFSEPFNMKLMPKKDIDWYKVDVKKQGYLKVSASDVPESVKPEVSFANYKQWEGDNEVYLREKVKIPAAAFVKGKNTYYIKIEDEYHNSESSEAFPIKVDFIKEMDDYEPNNSAENAKIVNDGDVINLAIFPDKDRDWYKIKIESQGYISLKAKNVPEDIVPEVSFAEYDEWADPKIKRIRDWEKIPAACFIPEKGEYYINIRDEYDKDMSQKLMDIKIDYVEEMDKYEPNDDHKNAKLIERNSVIKPAIYPLKDKDYYKFVLKEDKKVRFVTSNVNEKVTPEVRIYKIDNENKENLESVTDWKKCPAEFELELNQGYFLLLHDEYDNSSSQETFKFKME